MRIDIITLFPTMCECVLSESIIGRAQKKKKVSIYIHDLRKWTYDTHKTVDDKAFGGGVGMVMMPGPLWEAIEDITGKTKRLKLGKPYIIFPSPQGKVFTQRKAHELNGMKHIIFICGHYEGVDERVIEKLVDEEISVGNYVLTGGELPTMTIVDSLVRLIPGVLEKDEATKNESYELTDERGHLLLEAPIYTRPAEFRGMSVPEVLLSGDHKKVEKWKKDKAIEVTVKKRPDLLRD